MDQLLNLFNTATTGSSYSSSLDNLFNVSDTTMMLIVGLCFFGTNLVSNITNRNSLLEYCTTFAGLFIGALLATTLISNVELVGTSELAQSAITANIGMTISALLMMAVFGREGYINN
ncbi:MAG TPA: hypothetical protein ENJ55_05835 [Rhizobiales bacterium]|nr:hypothetical protein [Hyphomicrobiales bacterium]